MANTMLMTFFQEGKVSRREMKVTYLFNSGLPTYLLHLPTTFFIILPLTREAGLIYLSLTFAAALLRSFFLLAYGRWRLPAGSEGAGSLAVATPEPKEKVLQEIWTKFSRRFTRVVFYTLPIYFLIFTATDWGLFRWLRDAAAGHVAVSFLPVEAASVVIFSVATEFTSGMAAAGAFLQSGALTIHQTVLALVLGNIVATPIRALRLDVFVPSEIIGPGGAPGRAVLFARLGTSMRDPVIRSSEAVTGGTRVVVIDIDYALLDQLGAYDAPADQS